jgi:anti-sigma factor RsiW
MSCSPFDLKDYFLQELPASQRVQVEGHVRQCAGCREDLERLQMMQSALFSLRDEEIPQRIAFVSDPIFEPSPVRRWLGGFWTSTARLGFASAAMLSLSIFYFAATRPAPAPERAAVPTMAAAAPASLLQKEMTQEQIDQQIQQAVVKAVADVEARQNAKTTQLAADLESRATEMRNSLLLAADQQDDMSRKHDQVQRKSLGLYVQPGERQ